MKTLTRNIANFALGTILLAGCAGTTGTGQERLMNEEQATVVADVGGGAQDHALRLPASFRGDLPCADCEGVLKQLPGMEGGRLQSTLVVDRFIAVRPGVACSQVMATASLINTYWRIERMRGAPVEPVPESREPHLLLREVDNDQDFAATVGCNRMQGRFDSTRSWHITGDVFSLRDEFGDEIALLTAVYF